MAVIVEIGGKEIALRPEGDTGRHPEPAIEPAGGSDCQGPASFFHKLSGSIEDLDAVGIAVCDIEVAVPVKRHVGRIDKGADAMAFFAGRAHRRKNVPSGFSSSTRWL